MNYLKKITLVFLCIFMASSCSSDDDSIAINNLQISIIGNWLYTSSTFNGMNDPFGPCDDLSTLIFTATQVTSTEYFGNNCDQSDSNTETYAINGNIISVTFQGDTYTAEIITLNATTLTLKEVEGTDEYTDTYTRQ